MLKLLGVSSSGYYLWKNRKESNQVIKRIEIKEEIIKIWEKSKKIYGSPKITKELAKKGYKISQKTVSKYMKELGIKAIWVKKYRVNKTKELEVELKNILKREFNPKEANAVWVTDITYIWTKKGFVYLSSIMDLYSRKIISWDVSASLEITSVLKTVEKAKKTRKISKPLIIHSDRGSHYTSNEYKKITKHPNIIRSYSRKGNPWDNAVIESFHSIIKREWLNRFKIEDLQDAKALIFEYIETFYNTRRLHSYCGLMSPAEYETLYA